MAQYGFTADLIVAARGTAEHATAPSTLEAVLVETGRPLLIPSIGAPLAEMTDRVAIPWKPTPQTARAVAAAMPLLAGAKEIAVMTVEEEEDRGDDADRLVRNLAWHGPGPRTALPRESPGAWWFSIKSLSMVLGMWIERRS